MEVTKWYCDRCGEEFYAHGKLKPIGLRIGQVRSDIFRSEDREFCDKCFAEVKEKLLSVLLQKGSRE